MELLSIDGQLLYRMLISGANCLENNKAIVNSLNVFPVPDGDTGTNMSMTMASAIKEMQKLKERSVEAIAEAAANGSLMGARGNSGVILSQLIRGFAKGVKGKKALNCKDLSFALKEGANTAYKAVMKPTEGTILTVAREAADKSLKLSKSIDDISVLEDQVIKYAESVLDKTPDMLPVLKKAGVVDSGGKGLIFIYKGMLDALLGKDAVSNLGVQKEAQGPVQGKFSEEEIKYGYCTEFIIKNTDADPIAFRKKISEFGDSILVVGGEGIIKVHIHTNNPGRILSYALELGELTKIKVDNMKEQHRSLIGFSDDKNDDGAKPKSADEKGNDISKKAGVIAVASGEGIRNIFLDLGADKVIEGGQTMNPSTEDILNAINDVNARDIYILPNNGNIIMAAKQAAAISDKNIVVIPSKSIPQGIAALTVFNPENESSENLDIMTSTMKYVKTGQVTYAVRDTNFDDKKIKEGDILGLVNGKINNTGKDVINVTRALIESMVSEDDELITVLYGDGVKADEADKLSKELKSKYTDCEVQLYDGGQKLYYFIISVE
ncbi:MAG TPA: dihydroxyacetone kinase [Clostridiaceae bacterium]|nr:dihydroxyacetone kinase [Clostridiaceae bacterium]